MPVRTINRYILVKWRHLVDSEVTRKQQLPTERLNANEVAALLAQQYGLTAAGVDVRAIQAGPSSQAWRIDVRGDRRSFCLKDNKERSEGRLRAEHAFTAALREAGFGLAPEVVACTAGDTVVLQDGRAYALYRFIESDPVFNWTVGGWGKEEARAAGAALAEFHAYGERCREALTTVGAAVRLGELRPGLAESEPATAQNLREWGLAVLRRASGLFPDDVMIRLGNFEEVLRSAFVVLSDVRTHGMIHGDFHPGNVLFSSGHVVGLLDYEYCRIDSRLFDVAYATMTFSFEHMDAAYALALLDGYNSKNEFGAALNIAQLQPLVRLSAWLSAVWLIEQCQKGAAGHDEVLPALRKCIAILAASLD
jgi:Ser/Thr protein kinase RdoA (MazF antagonist)